MKKIVSIENEVPFGRNIYAWLYLNQQHIQNLVKHDRVEMTYLAWESVRKELNPFFRKGTGFEGYLVGRCAAPDEALTTILDMSQHILDAIARCYRFQQRFRSQLMKAITRDGGDWTAIHTWSDYLGAELGKLRAQILLCEPAQNFQQRTYNIVRTLPPMVFQEIGFGVRQRYALIGDENSHNGKLHIRLETLNPSQQDAWLVAENIGQFGHPVIRKLLNQMR